MKVKVTYKEGFWFCSCSYDDRHIPKQAQYKWDSVKKEWYTDRASIAWNLERYFDDTARERVEISKKEEAKKIESSRAMSASIDVPCPDGIAYRSFQLAGIEFALSRKYTLIGDEMGIGKTIQAIGVMNKTAPARVLIICPKSLKLNWQKELERWLVFNMSIQRPGAKDEITGDIVILNPDVVGKLREKIDQVEWDILILDEFHFYKNPKSNRTRFVLGGKVDDVQYKPIQSGKTIMLTGTPIPNRPVELWPVMKYTGIFTNFRYFTQRYCAAYQDRFGWNASGASNLEELQDLLRTKIMIRRLKKDVLSELPPKMRQVIEIENGRNDTENDFLSVHGIVKSDSDFEEKVQKLMTQQVFFTEMSRIRHLQGLEKVSHACDFIQDILDENESQKLIVFCWHNDVAEEIHSQFLSYGSVLYHGKTDERERNRAVESFQGDEKTRIFVGTMGSAGVGLTLTAAKTVVFVEFDWVPANLMQSEDRCHRIGQTEPVNVYYLVFQDSIDGRILKSIVKKMDVQDRALDRRDLVGKLFEKDESRKKESGIPEANKPKAEETGQPKPSAEEKIYSKEEIQAMREKLQYLSSCCDGAHSKDGSGFNRYDSEFGKSMAGKKFWSQKMAVAAEKLLKKYKNQLNDISLYLNNLAFSLDKRSEKC